MDKNVYKFRIIGFILLIISLISLVINIKVLELVTPSNSLYWLSIISFITGVSSLFTPKYNYCTLCTLSLSFTSVICGIIIIIAQCNWLTALKNNIGCIYSNGNGNTTYNGNNNYYQFTENCCINSIISSSKPNSCYCSNYNYDSRVGGCSEYSVDSCEYLIQRYPSLVKAGIVFSGLIIIVSFILYLICCFEICFTERKLLTDVIDFRNVIEIIRTEIQMPRNERFINLEKNEIPMKELMWTRSFIGLYAHYALVGYSSGTLQGLVQNFCYYSLHGPPNLCINAYNIIVIPWNIKFFYAMITDIYRPFGFRRRPYMITGWISALLFTFILAMLGKTLQGESSGVYTWIGLNFVIQIFLILADVSADGMSVEIGRYEKENERGTVLVTGQFIKFWFSVGASFLQAFFMNGPDTNPTGCPINASNCWSWGLNLSQFYGFSTALIAVLLTPILFLKEFDPSHVEQHTFSEHATLLWETIKNRACMYMLIYVGFGFSFGAMSSACWSIFVFNVIKLTNLELGVSNLISFGAMLIGIYLFRKYLLDKNWRMTQYFSFLSQATFSLLMLLPYNNIGSFANPWFVIFCGVLTSFAQSFCQCLYGLAVIEISGVGQEASTYELIVSSHNAAGLIGSLVSTQLLGVSGIVNIITFIKIF